jgi:pyruvate,water dikinase
MNQADFTPVWDDPADAALMWAFEPIHYGDAQPPLMQEIQAHISASIGVRVKYVNGYCYVNGLVVKPPSEDIVRRGNRAVWLEDCQPRVQEIVEKHRNGDYDAMSAAALVQALPSYFKEAGEAFALTFVTFASYLELPVQLNQLCEREFGADGPAIANAVMQGYANKSLGDGEALEALANFAALRPELEEALRDGRYEDVASVPGGSEFEAQLREYLEAYGRRAQSWSLGHLPTAAEDPSQALSIVRHYLDDAGMRPSQAAARAAAQRDGALQRARSQLSGEALAQFESLVEACRDYVAQSEERAFWQLTSVGMLRVPVLALGRKLVATGVLEDARDAYFFTTAELAAAASSGASLVAAAAERKAELAWQRTLTPPPFIGTPPSGGGMPPGLGGFFRYYGGVRGGPPAAPSATITGMAASKGTARGTARVIRDLTEADRLQPGDILVCRTTAAPWTPLFGIAAAVVTDSGGILSHSAICAREYAIPAVVGTQIGTARIPDGAAVVVDGDAGTVTIEQA